MKLFLTIFGAILAAAAVIFAVWHFKSVHDARELAKVAASAELQKTEIHIIDLASLAAVDPAQKKDVLAQLERIAKTAELLSHEYTGEQKVEAEIVAEHAHTAIEGLK